MKINSGLTVLLVLSGYALLMAGCSSEALELDMAPG